MNERETRVQKRNRWREASRRVMSCLQLHHMTKRDAINMPNAAFAKVWKAALQKGGLDVESSSVGGEGEMKRRVDQEMVSIWREQGGEAEKGGVEDRVGKRLTRGATERATDDSQAAQLRSMLAKVREADNGAMLRGTPVGCRQKVKAEDWLSE